MSRKRTYSGLESRNLLIRHCVGLSDDRNKVDLRVEPAHEFNIYGLEPMAPNEECMGSQMNLTYE